MYKEHPHFIDMPNNTVIWKYLDLFKYLDLLNTSTLFMQRCDHFIDKLDGSSPDREHLMYKFPDLDTEQVNAMLRMYDVLKRSTYVSSWHINDFESSVMWDAYSNNQGGLAIKTTVGNLKDSIIDESSIYFSKVVYTRNDMPMWNTFFPIFHKREQFTDERECRLFLNEDFSKYAHPTTDHLLPLLPSAKKIAINTDVLMEQVFFHPLTSDWVADSVAGVIKQFGGRFVPVKSTLYS